MSISGVPSKMPLSAQSGRKQTPARALEGGRRTEKAAATAKTDTAEFSFMCSIFLLMFFIGFLPKQTCFTRSAVNAVPKLSRCSFFSVTHSVPRMVNKNSFLVVIQSTFFVIFQSKQRGLWITALATRCAPAVQVILVLDPRIHLTTGTLLISLWIAGSSPAMTKKNNKSSNDIVNTIPQENTKVNT